MVNSTHNLSNPSHVTVNELRRCVKVLCIGEEIVNILYAVLKECVLHASETLSIAKDFGKFGMSQNLILILHIIFKDILFHFFFSFIIFGFIKSLSYKSIHNLFLLFIHSFDHIADSTFVCHFFILLFFFRLFSLFFRFISMRYFIFNFFSRSFFYCLFFCMSKFELFSCKYHSFIRRLFAMNKNRINKCSRISASKNQTYFTDCSMNDVSTNLFKLICINRKGFDIPMYDLFPCVTPCLCVVQRAVCVYTLRSVL